MRQFFLQYGHQSTSAGFARAYANHFHHNARSSSSLLADKSRTDRRSRFHVGLSVLQGDFEDITKRAALVSDTLLLVNDRSAPFVEVSDLGISPRSYISRMQGGSTHLDVSDYGIDELSEHGEGYMVEARRALINSPLRDADRRILGMHCPDIDELGRWIQEAKPLLEAGLTWYLPLLSEGVCTVSNFHARMDSISEVRARGAVDFLIRDRRAVDTSGVHPIKSALVRPIFEMELPYIEGTTLNDFSKITTEEFGSYSAFRDFLRAQFADLEVSLDAVQSERELMKIETMIRGEVRAVQSQFIQSRRRKAVGVTGAVVGTVAATLTAVYGPALAQVVPIAGASGGLWQILQAQAETSGKTLKEGPWSYVWSLARKSSVL